MQHRYFGDVGDFGKYGLLRALCGLNEMPRLRLGIVWYLYPDESHNEDGKHLGYLKDPSYRFCDEALYDSLRTKLLDDSGTLRPDSRHLNTLGAMGMMPSDTLYDEEPLSFARGLPSRERRSIRNKWFAGALAQTLSADLVFLDPDNGIECASVRQLSKKGPKYVYWDDMAAFLARGQSLVVYHHLNRSAAHAIQVKRMLEEIQRRFPHHEPMATVFRRGSGRAYFIIPSRTHYIPLRERLDRFTLGRWKDHFVTQQSNRSALGSGANGLL